METSHKYNDCKYYLNRELSWLKFEERVLNEASDCANPLMERINFLSITASNLDEFFMIRVASLKESLKDNAKPVDISGLSPSIQLELISKEVHKITSNLYELYAKQKSHLNDIGIRIISKYELLSDEESKLADCCFEKNIAPILTPFVIDSTRPFPLIKNKCINVGFFLKDNKTSAKSFAYIQLPNILERLVKVSSSGNSYLLLEELILNKAKQIFNNHTILESCFFRITRDAELRNLEKEGNIADIIMKQVKERQWSSAVRLELSSNASLDMETFLVDKLSLTEAEVYRIPDSLDLTFLSEIYALDNYHEYRLPIHVPKKVPEADGDIFSYLQKKDLLLCHPFEEYDPVVNLVSQAANDPDVLSIKQTLYRLADNSAIVDALSLAAENGKQVTVLIELKARFDEEKNIKWARKLEKAGCIVLYGSADLKTHCKITLVIRRENDELRPYVHLGTGNYNEATAKLYTDISLLTARKEFGEDAVKVFNMLSGYSRPLQLSSLYLAPYGLKEKLLELISREKSNALKGLKAEIRAKMNSLCDRDIIEALYEASEAGVKIELVVRGICCIKPGYSGIGNNISVKSIVGTFLEHSRIYFFENAGNNEYYCSSADWMPRNFDRRVELMYPIEDKENCEKLNRVLTMTLSDNCKAHRLGPDGDYIKISVEENDRINSQELLKSV